MRTRLTAENTYLADASKRFKHFLEIKNAGGTWVDYADWNFGPYFHTFSRYIRFNESLDDPVPSIQCGIRLNDESAGSLSPFRGDSSLNPSGPAIDVGREIRVRIAYTDSNGSWPAIRTVFHGVIDSFDAAGPDIDLTARIGPGSRMVDSWIKDETPYAATDTRLDLVISAIMSDWLVGWSATLQVPTTPAFNMLHYEQQKESVFDAARTLAGLIGWDIRFKWHEGSSAFQPFLIQPARTQTTPDYTFPPSQLIGVQQLGVDRTWIRNIIRVTYINSTSNSEEYVEVSDSTSIARYGEHWAEIVRGQESSINTSTEATALANAVLSDLAYPIADQVVELPYFWPCELGDLYRFSANGIHYNTNQDLAVTGHRWEITGDRIRSFLSVRGKPAGFYRTWINEIATPQPIPYIPVPRFITEPYAEGSSIYGISGNADTQSITISDGTTTLAFAGSSVSKMNVAAAWTFAQGNNTTKAYTITLRDVPPGETPVYTAVREVTVIIGAPGSNAWDFVGATSPSLGSGTMTITLDAVAASDTTQLEIRSSNDGVNWSSYSDITSSVSPSLTTPPASSTNYTYATGTTRVAKTTPPGPVYYVEIRARIKSGATVLDTRTAGTNWYANIFA